MLLIPLCVVSVVLSLALGSKSLAKKHDELSGEWQKELAEAGASAGRASEG